MTGKKRRRFSNRDIEKAIEDAEPAADWLMNHPPGARLPDALEPGYVPEDVPCAPCSSAAGEEVWHGSGFCPRWEADDD